MAPLSGSHSVMDSPDSVRRVMPPMTIWPTTMTRPTSNQIFTARG